MWYTVAHLRLNNVMLQVANDKIYVLWSCTLAAAVFNQNTGSVQGVSLIPGAMYYVGSAQFPCSCAKCNVCCCRSADRLMGNHAKLCAFLDQHY